VDKQIVGPDPDIALAAALPLREQVEDRPDPERREDVRRDLQAELASDRSGLFVNRIS